MQRKKIEAPRKKGGGGLDRVASLGAGGEGEGSSARLTIAHSSNLSFEVLPIIIKFYVPLRIAFCRTRIFLTEKWTWSFFEAL